MPSVSWRMPTAAEAQRLGMDDEAHKMLAAEAVRRIDDPDHPLNADADAVANAAGMTAAEARARRGKPAG